MKRKHIIIIVSVSILLLILAAGSTWYLNPVLEKSLDTYLREKIEIRQASPNYAFSYEDLELNVMQKRLVLKNFTMKPRKEFLDAFLKGETEANSIKEVVINQGVIQGIGLTNFLWNKHIDIDSIHVDSVSLDLYLAGRSKKLQKKEGKPVGKVLEGIRLPGIRKLSLGSFDLDHLSLHQMRFPNQDTLIKFTSDGGRLEGIGIAKPQEEDASFFAPELEDFTLYLGREKLDLRENLYTMGFRNMEYSYADRNLHVRDLLFRPREDRDSFRLKNQYSYEVYQATSTDLILEDFNLNAFLDKGEFLMDKMLIDSLRLEIFRDKSLPFNTQKKKLLINQKLTESTFPLYIGEIGFRDAYLNYVEQVEVGVPPLVVDFSDMDGKIENFTSLPERQLDSVPLKITLSASLDQEIPMAIEVEMPYGTDHFTAKGHTEGTSNFSSLNKTVLPAIGLQFESGRLDGLMFDMWGTPRSLRGNLTLLYHNLDVALYKDNHEKRKTLSWAANLLLKKSNPKPNGNTIVSEIYTERTPYKGLANYLWKGLESGIINSLNPFGKHKVVRK